MSSNHSSHSGRSASAVAEQPWDGRLGPHEYTFGHTFTTLTVRYEVPLDITPRDLLADLGDLLGLGAGGGCFGGSPGKGLSGGSSGGLGRGRGGGGRASVCGTACERSAIIAIGAWLDGFGIDGVSDSRGAPGAIRRGWRGRSGSRLGTRRHVAKQLRDIRRAHLR